MDNNIALWTITWTITWKIKQRGRWSEEILFIFPENFTPPPISHKKYKSQHLSCFGKMQNKAKV